MGLIAAQPRYLQILACTSQCSEAKLLQAENARQMKSQAQPRLRQHESNTAMRTYNEGCAKQQTNNEEM
eukprot:169921-Amphidinium_carterae.1